MNTLHEDLYTLIIIFRSILLIRTGMSDKVVKKIKTYILRQLHFLLENRAVME
jgi:hypothetical protein